MTAGSRRTASYGPSAMTRPCCITMTRSASSATTPMLCSTRRTVRPARTCRTSAIVRCTSSRLMPDVGSSSRSTFGSSARASASSSARFWPYGRLPAVRAATAASPTSSRIALARSRYRATARSDSQNRRLTGSATCSARTTFSRPVRRSNRLVTGAASGIGRAIAEDLASRGARVLLADIDEPALRSVAAPLRDAVAQRADMSSRDDCRALVERARRAWGGVDILVNNAGLQEVSPIEDFPEDRWEHLVRVMLIGAFLLTKYAIPDMYRKRWGRIVNISSLHGLVASPYKSAYVSAKHGLMGLTKTVALEAADKGVTVNAVCPSYVRTPLVEKQIADQARVNKMSEEEVIEKIMHAPAAIKRLLEPSEVAAYVSFLCSDA